MATYALGGFQTLAQTQLTSTIASQGYAKSALLYALAGIAGGADLLQIGRPNEGAVFSGAPVSMADKMTLPNKSSYAPRIQGFKTSNTAVIGARANMTTVANPTTASQGQAVQYAAKFNWMMYMQTPLEIWQVDLDRAIQGGGTQEGQGLAVGSLVESATSVGTEEHLDQLASRMLYGAPTNQFVDPVDDLQGVLAAAGTTNVYGQVDRSGLSAGDPWLPGANLSTSFPKDIYQIIQYFNTTAKMGVFGGGINLILAGGDNYLVFKNQILARTKDAGMVQSSAGMGLPSMAKMGVEREVLRADNVYVMHEPFLDTCYGTQAGTTTPLYTARPTYVIGLNLKLWKLIFMPKYNMKIRPFVDVSDKSVGAPKATISFIETCAILSCDRPSVGVGIMTGLV